jgi:hypothetical protein
MFVPVFDIDGKTPLMPTTSGRARRWIESGKATPFWQKGIFCVRLNQEPSDNKKQVIAIGVDPGSKKEGFTIKSASHTYLNIQADAVTWVKKHIEVRKMMRHSRRLRNTPYRKRRFNRSKSVDFLAPSTKARWQWKLRICNWLSKLYPIEVYIVEEVRALFKKGKKLWNEMFAPLIVGRDWFYSKLSELGKLIIKFGYETKKLRDSFGLKKSRRKLANLFESHCVDSWVLANDCVGGHVKPDNKEIVYIIPLRFHRRQLHRINPVSGGIRHRYGGTISLGFKRGSLVKHVIRGIAYIGGYAKNLISLHDIHTGNRIFKTAKPEDLRFLTYNTWRLTTVS